MIVGGDFNAHNDFFEPGVNNMGRGGELADWSNNSLMYYIGEVGVSTHDRGHVLDLTFSNIPFASTKVRKDLATGSDHVTLITTIPGLGQKPAATPVHRVTEAGIPVKERENDVFS